MARRLFDRLIDRIRELREQRQLTQEAFAEKAAISYKYYQAIEAGRRMDLRLSTLERLARAHGLEVWQLLQLPLPAAPATIAKKPARTDRALSTGARRTVAAKRARR